jgi:SpoIID/LytB domain protein
MAACRRLAAPILALGLLLVSVAPATAADLSFSGAGWGHGVGLSQYGAKAMGADGASYSQIIHRYFTGVGIGPLSVASPGTFVSTDLTPLWVGLIQRSGMVSFRIESGSANLCFDNADACVGTGQAGETYRFGSDGGGNCVFLRLTTPAEVQAVGLSGSCAASVRPLTAETTITIPFKARSYRHGFLRFRQGPTTGEIHTVYEIGVDDYMRGLSEVPESWPMAAIEAQVVVSRSFAVWHALDRGGGDNFTIAQRDDCFCNLRDDASDQVFLGWTGEVSHPRWVSAVLSTAQQVMHSAKGVALGLYSSSSGGATENYADVFGEGSHPYLATVGDSPAFSVSAANPHRNWGAGYGQASLATLYGFSWLTNAEVIERNDSGSARTVRLTGIVDGRPTEITVSGVGLQTSLSLRSTSFEITMSARFSDVAIDHSFAGEILGLSELGITLGCSAVAFCPRQPVSRAEMAAFLTRATEIPPSVGGTPFTDVGGHHLEAEISALYANGITSGCTATQFCPERPVTRAEMAAFLVRAFDLGVSTAVPFTDVDGHHLEAEISALYANGITSGCTATQFCPERPVTRAEMAAFIVRSLA